MTNPSLPLYRTQEIGTSEYVICDSTNHAIARMIRQYPGGTRDIGLEARASYLFVHAANHHQALVRALREILAIGERHTDSAVSRRLRDFHQAIAIARAALEESDE